VAILERERQPPIKVGEHIRPEALPELDALQLPREGRASYLMESGGIRVAWGSTELRERDYLFDYVGSACNVDRHALESALARRSVESGATLIRGVSQTSVQRERDGLWRIDANVDGVPAPLRARWLLDATGRRAWVARQMGACLEHVDRSVALVGRLDCIHPIPGVERLLVESAPDGWWYSVAVPDGSLVAVYITDADIRPGPERNASGIWTAALAHTEHTRERLLGATLASPISVHGAHSAFLTPAVGSGWIAIGDAAWRSDPLAGIGVSEALQSGRAAAGAVDAACSGDESVLSEYVQSLNQRINSILAALLQAYRQELRWSDHPFWQRRHAAPDRIAPITLPPDALVRLSPASLQKRPALGIAPQHVATLLTLAPTPREAASVLHEFTTRCPVGATTALRALQALAEVVS
jgi:flavin-dependent dehydrogenase